jgi:hypothetical protein
MIHLRIVLAAFLLMVFSQTIVCENRPGPIKQSGPGLVTTPVGPAWMGWSLIAAEYLAGPFIAYQYWWKDGLSRNPFDNIFEGEPYLEDKTWHFWNGANLTDLHYWTLSKFFGIDSRWAAMGMTFFTLTTVELLDGSDRDRKWGVSWRDEVSNVSGILLWYLRQKFPQYVPVDVRVGIRRWDRVPFMVANVVRDIKTSDSEHYRSLHMNNYSIFKTEIIVRPYNYFYTGLAVSCKTDSNGMGIPENLFGITAGIDILRWYANKYKGKCTPFANFLGQNLSLPLSFTYWFGK